MKPAVLIFVGLLLILHQDYWQWESTPAVSPLVTTQFDIDGVRFVSQSRSQLIFGALPYALVYHMGISLAAAIGWLLVTRFCWPENLDRSPDAERERGES